MNLIELKEFPNYKVTDVNHLLDNFFKNDWSFKNSKKLIRPIFDTAEDDKEYVLFSEIPGVSKSDLKVEVFEKRIKISGTKKVPNEFKNKPLHFNRLNFGDFERSFNLPDKIDKDKIEATFNDGFLKVILPKKKHIEIKPNLIKIK